MPPPSSVPKRRVKGKPISESDTDSSWAKLSLKDAMDSDVDTVKSMEVVKSDAGGSASDASETMSSVASGPSRRVGSEASVASGPAESESTRQEHFSKLRVVIYNLQEVDKKLAAFNVEATWQPRRQVKKLMEWMRMNLIGPTMGPKRLPIWRSSWSSQ